MQTIDQMRNLALSVALLFIGNPVLLKSQTVRPFDIMITELMIDPNPVVGLPNFEWIELYNRSDRTINLEDFLYSSGSTKYRLPIYDLESGGYVMICDDSDIDELSMFGDAIDIKTFPSLTNGGDVATLEDPDGNLIHEVIYQKSWYGDTDKDDGGYTLEIINPNDPCLAISNWMASSSETGATPAAQNSNWMPSIPLAGVLVQDVTTTSSSELQVTFDRIPSSSTSEMDFSITPALGIIDIMSNEDDGRLFSLFLSEHLNSGVVYTLTINSKISDCIGLPADVEQTISFVLPEAVFVGDLVINEVLFNPIGTESDYIEIYNTSSKFLNIRQLMLGNLASDGSGSTKEIDTSYVLAPMEYLLLTEDAISLSARFPSTKEEKVLEVDLPSFNNSAGNVTLFVEENGIKTVIDGFDYEEGMHNTFIDDPEGVSLERVAFDRSSSERINWQSAAASIGYGSPTLPNSQRLSAGTESGELVFLESNTFYPQEQSNDQLVILFQVERPDFIGTIDVWDSAGRYIRQLANNQLIGRNDQYFWDGRSQDGILLNAGVYIIVIQLVTAEGDLVTKKLPCVLSRRL